MNDLEKKELVDKLHDMFLVLQSVNECYTTKESLQNWLKWRLQKKDSFLDNMIQSTVNEFLSLLTLEDFVKKQEEIPEDFDLDIKLNKTDVIYKINKPLAYVNFTVKNGLISVIPANFESDKLCEIEK